MVDEDGSQVGVLPREQALELAQERNLDLVLVAPRAEPPVCRLMNWSKHQYEQERKERKARRSKERPPHQIRLRPNIAEHDYQTKRKSIEKFLLRGDKVRVNVVMRGRLGTHPEIGQRLLQRFVDDLQHCSEVLSPVRREGPQWVVLLAPRAGVTPAAPEPTDTPAETET